MKESTKQAWGDAGSFFKSMALSSEFLIMATLAIPSCAGVIMLNEQPSQEITSSVSTQQVQPVQK